jgi:hypothetical protein
MRWQKRYAVSEIGSTTDEVAYKQKPANLNTVDYVLSHKAHDGRSEFVWLRLNDYSLVLGVFPQGDVYDAVREAPSPEDEWVAPPKVPNFGMFTDWGNQVVHAGISRAVAFLTPDSSKDQRMKVIKMVQDIIASAGHAEVHNPTVSEALWDYVEKHLT